MYSKKCSQIPIDNNKLDDSNKKFNYASPIRSVCVRIRSTGVRASNEKILCV